MESKAKIIPSIRYNNCEKAIDWLCEAFDFEIYLKVPSDNGGILHAQLIYNDCMCRWREAKGINIGTKWKRVACASHVPKAR